MKKIDVNSVDLERLRNTFAEMDNNTGDVGLALLEEIEFQRRTLIKMREEIDTNSLTADYSNYKRSNPIIAGYNAMVKNYSQLVRQAIELLPDESQNNGSIDDIDLSED